MLAEAVAFRAADAFLAAGRVVVAFFAGLALAVAVLPAVPLVAAAVFLPTLPTAAAAVFLAVVPPAA
ncbi:hypothetical protein, partial [Paractinoplanes brasiliensis]|uniref:hypothetical protein n=1 Tax=Paractinoplanes brasiliensis TaxID=52695 RepID=UPI001941BCA0